MSAEPTPLARIAEKLDGGPSRRAMLLSGALAPVAALTGSFRAEGPLSLEARAALPGFPAAVSLECGVYRNWSGEIEKKDIPIAVPHSPAELVELANWAKDAGRTLRPSGHSHGWSPFIVGYGEDKPTILVDLRPAFSGVEINTTDSTVRAGAGLDWEALLTKLEAKGLGVFEGPAPGDITVGGIMAINAHGTGFKVGGNANDGFWGSTSNRILSLKALVWDEATNSFAVKTFTRDTAEGQALMTGLGRILVTEFVIKASKNRRIRCQSFTNISKHTIFAAPEKAGSQSFAGLMEKYGACEVIWFPFTPFPWTKVWSESPTKPLFSRTVTGPFNYPFAENMPNIITSLIADVTTGLYPLTPAFMNSQMALVSAGLVGTFSQDIWGWSKNSLMYVKPSTLRVTANGYAILCRRGDVQRVVSEFFDMFWGKMQEKARVGKFPINGPLEVRVTELDHPLPGTSGNPSLSTLRPDPEHPEFDVAVWLDILTLPGTKGADAFYREVEGWMEQNYTGDYAMIRPEWSKAWAYTDQGAWKDASWLDEKIPASLGRENWDSAVATLHSMDPHKVFASAMHDRLFHE